MNTILTILAWALLILIAGIIVGTCAVDSPVKIIKEALKPVDPNDEEEW